MLLSFSNSFRHNSRARTFKTAVFLNFLCCKVKPGNDSCGSKCYLPQHWRKNSTDIHMRFRNSINNKSQRHGKGRSSQLTQKKIWIGNKCKFGKRKDQLIQALHLGIYPQLLNFIWHCVRWKLSHWWVWKLLTQEGFKPLIFRADHLGVASLTSFKQNLTDPCSCWSSASHISVIVRHETKYISTAL